MSMEQFLVEQNVTRFLRQLADEPEPSKRATLSQLLLEEAGKLASLPEYRADMDGHVAGCDGLIEKYRAQIGSGIACDVELNCMRTVLIKMLAIRATLQPEHPSISRV